MPLVVGLVDDPHATPAEFLEQFVPAGEHPDGFEWRARLRPPARHAGFVLPATLDEREDTEGLGVVLLEAMSHALPVLATRRGGITDVVIDGRTGILVEDEIPALEAGVRRLLEDPAAAREMGERGRDRVRTAFGWDRIVDRLEAVYGRGPVGR